MQIRILSHAKFAEKMTTKMSSCTATIVTNFITRTVLGYKRCQLLIGFVNNAKTSGGSHLAMATMAKAPIGQQTDERVGNSGDIEHNNIQRRSSSGQAYGGRSGIG